MSEMALVMTEKVNNTMVNGYWMDGKPWFTRYQIGAALGYEFPVESIGRIHNRHKERLDQFSRVSQFDSPSGKQLGYIYDERGVFEICRWSRQPKADMVMDRLYEMALRIIHDQTVRECFEKLKNPVREYLPSASDLREMREDRSFSVINLCNEKSREEVLSELREIWVEDIKGYKRMVGEYNLRMGLSRKGGKTKAQKERERREKMMNEIIMR